MDEMQRQEFILATFHAYIRNSQDMIFAKDTNLVYVTSSDSFAKLVGKRCGEALVGLTDFDVFETELAIKYTKDDRGVLDSGVNIVNYIEPLPDQNGEKSYSSTSKYVVRDKDGKTIGLYGIARDVTAQIELEEARESSRLSRQMFDDVLEADLTENRILRVEGSEWVRALDVSEDSVFTQTVDLLAARFIHPDYRAEFVGYYDLEKLKTAYENGVHEFSHLTLLHVNEDNYRWIECRSRVYHSRISNTLRITTFLKDTDDDVRSRQRLQKKAVTDALTGLSNRENTLERILSYLGNGESQRYALLFIDLDRFKQVNDRWGHLFGDKVLQKMADRLRLLFGEEHIYGRIGGDEFLVFLGNTTSRATVSEKAWQIVNQLSFYHYENQDEIYVTCSVGVAIFDGGGTTVEQLYERADRAMYRAKENGRNRVYFYEDL